MSVRRTGFVLAVLLAGVIPVQAADRPPKDLHIVGDHWTAWNPPTPAATDQVHVVVKGDTLWDIAAKYYGNAYLWPQVWEKNKYILDAHWIYPGDPLVLGLNVAPAQSLADASAGVAGGGDATPGVSGGPDVPPPPGVVGATEAAGSPVPLGAETDIYCQGYVGDLDESFPFTIAGSEADALSVDQYVLGENGWQLGNSRSFSTTTKIDLAAGDIIYIDGGRAKGLSAGELLTAVARDQPVTHPLSGRVVGRYYRYLGRIRVLSVQETTAIAEIVQSCDPIVTGAFLQPFEPEPVPLGRSSAMRPINYPAAAEKLAKAPAVIFSRDDVISLGADQVVHIDVGEANATPGDIYTIYRENKPGLPPLVIGELAVLSVHKRFSVAKIIESRYPVRLGDRLDPK
jgi:hypothetical protein